MSDHSQSSAAPQRTARLSARPGFLAGAFMAALIALFWIAPAAGALGPFGPCANDQLRTGAGSRLPDCRAYEQATPVAKNGGDALGATDFVQASAAGDAITYVVMGGIPGGVGSQDFPAYISRRGASNWATAGLLPPAGAGERARVRAFAPDLSLTFSDAEGADHINRFLARAPDGSLTMIASGALARYFLAGVSSDGSKVFFEADARTVSAPLAPGAAPGKDNLFVWDRDTGTISLAGVLPDSACGSPPCTPPGGSFAGPYSWFFTTSLEQGGASQGGLSKLYVQPLHAISAAGDRAYFTAGGTGQIYLREDPTGPSPSTAHVSASQRTLPDVTAPQPSVFMGATPDGAHAFFTSAEALTDDANTGPDPATVPPPPSIVRADPDGSNPEMDFIPASATGVAVDGAHVYWADPSVGTIGRADIDDGGNFDPAFIAGLTDPQALTVDAGHLYWADPTADAIGRADLEGDDVKADFIALPGPGAPSGVAVNSGHIYWTNENGSHGTIGRASLEGTGIEESFVELDHGGSANGIAVDESHIFYVARGYEVARRDLDGKNEIYISFGSGCLAIRQLALDSSHVFWLAQGHTGVNCGDPTEPSHIGRADLNLGEVNGHFVTGPSVDYAKSIAVDGSHLYWSLQPPRPSKPGNDLYRYDAADGSLTDLAPDLEDENGAEVRGVLGYSEDGSRVYFAANGDLDGPLGPATAGDCGWGLARTGSCSLYLADGGEVSFIARLDAGHNGSNDNSDMNNWRAGPFDPPDFSEKTSRVSADGETLLFRSQAQLTAYDNAGKPELYRYRAPEDELTCVSCDPSGAPPSSGASLQTIEITSPTTPTNDGTVLTRNLSVDGDRVFFDTTDALLPEDVNGLQDVYEWEAEGSGSCATAGGCLYLISPGTGLSPSYFADASLSGDDALFFTREQLVPQDRDQLQDVYDAGVGGGLAAQHAVAPPPCAAEACRGASSPAPPQQGSASSSFSGPGNPPVKRPPARCRGKKQGKKHRCKAKGHRKHRRAIRRGPG
jgi:hypothetical protein